MSGPDLEGTPDVPRGLLRALVRPHPRIQDKDLRRRATLHSGLLLALIGGAVGAVAAEEVEHGVFGHIDAAHAVMWIGLALLLAAYGLSRTRHYRLSAVITVLTTSTLIWRLWAVEPGAPTDILYFLALPIVFSAFLLPIAYTLVFIGLTLATLALVPTFRALLALAPAAADVQNVVIFLILVSLLLLAAAELLERSRRQLAEQTARAEEANERLKELEANRIQFLNQAAHDLASPITPIKIQVELLQKAVAGEADIPLGASVAMIDRNVRLFERLVGDVRDLAKLDGGKIQLDRSVVAMAEVCQAVEQFYRPLAETARVDLVCAIPEGLQVWADPRRVQQVLNNLVSNALKFTPGGRVMIEARDAADHIETRVTDTGRGLSGDEIAKLFRPFSQVHQHHEVKERGTGLGLYICKGIVEAHGGRISVESQGHGRGSRFFFTLPKPLPGASPNLQERAGSSGARL